jgi:hypothetical protein
MNQRYWKRWPVTCPECEAPTFVELPFDAVAGRSGATECSRWHSFAFRYDGETVEALRPQPSSRTS